MPPNANDSASRNRKSTRLCRPCTWYIPNAAIAVVVWYAMSRSRTNFNKRQQKVQAALRSLVLMRRSGSRNVGARYDV